MPRTANQTFVGLMDTHGNVYPLFQLADSHVEGSLGAASARIALPADAPAYLVSADKDCWIQFGDNTVTADNAGQRRLFLRGTEPVRPYAGATYIAFKSVDGSAGVISLTSLVGE